MSFFRSIKIRLTLWYLAIILGLLFVFGVMAYALLSHNLYQTLDDGLKTRVNEIEATIAFSDEAVFTAQADELVLLYGRNGALLRSFGPAVPSASVQDLFSKAQSGQSTFTTASTDNGRDVRLYAQSLGPGFNSSIIIIIGKPITDIENILETFRSILLFSALGAVIIAGIGGLFLAGRALKPVDRITTAAREIGENDLSRRIAVNSQDELGRLSSTLNSMIERIEKAFDRQRQFTADASHELRTPLAVMQAETSLALGRERSKEDLQNSLELVSQEISFMSAIIEKLLFLARSDSGKEPVNFTEVNLKNLLNEVNADAGALAREKNIDFTMGLVEDITIKGDAVKLRQLFLNLMENAVRYTPEGGRITSSLASKDGQTVVTISDTGIGIPAEHLPYIFDRFYRVDKARSRSEGGTGLGLAIARQIAESHGGRIEVESEVDKGSTFRVFLQ